MANTPKMKDPTEAALSAIQDALNVRDTEPSGSKVAPPIAAMPDDSLSERAWPGLRSSKAAKTDHFEDEAQRPEDTDTVRRPANDDRESIGQILRTLQRRPARTSYLLASVFAAVWVIAGLGLGFAYLPDIRDAVGPSGLTAPLLAVLGAIYLAPVVFFYVLAHMAWRSQELRLIAQSMAEVAMRLAEPETVAREFDRDRRSGDPARGRGHGRRRRARAGARRRA